MSGVFLSYSRGDRALAFQLVHGLRAVGVVVWWDEDMRGVDWQEELELQITGLAGVIVLWTPNSSASKHVKDEARLGLETDKLVNVIEGIPKPPFPYDRVNGLPMDGWTGREPHRGWTRLVETIEEKIVAAGGAKTGDITGALAQREKDVQQKQNALASARESFQDAQNRAGEAEEAAKIAGAALARAEEQHQRVVEMRATPAVQHTAQQELDDTRAAKNAADQAHRAAKTALGEASRGLARAQEALDRLFADALAPSVAPPSAAVTRAIHRATTATFTDRQAPARPARLIWFAGAAVVIGALTISVWLLVPHQGSQVAAQSVSAAEAAPPSSVVPALDPIAPAETAITGKWTLRDVSCAYAIKFAVQSGSLSVGGTLVKIASVDASGAIRTTAGGGADTYAVSGDTLTMTTPDGGRTIYSRCAG